MKPATKTNTVKIQAPSVSDNLLNGNSRLADLLASRKSNGKSPAVPAVNRSQPENVKPAVEPKLAIPAALTAVCVSCNDTEENDMRSRFVDALKLHQGTLSTLTDVTQEAIESGFDRDDCIEWGIAAGLSDGYVRSTVSRLFIDLVGRIRKAGAGPKRQKIAIRVAKLALKYHKGNYAKAKAVLLAARRALEAMEKQSLKD